MMTYISLGLMLAVLAFAAWSVEGSGWRLLLALVVMAFGVGSINPLIEAGVFHVMPLAQIPAALVFELLVAIVLSLAAIVVSLKWRGNDMAPAQPRFTPARLAGVMVCYTILYLVAGAFVWPFVKSFYAAKALPSMTMLVPLQLARGLLYAVFAWLWLRLAPRHSGLVLGLVYAVVGGVAPLMIASNPYMPEAVRVPHTFEVGISNFLFGLIVGWLVGPATPAPSSQALPAVPA